MQREISRQEVKSAIVEEGDGEDRDWVRKLNEHGANAKTLRREVQAKNPSMLTFREKMLKFTA